MINVNAAGIDVSCTVDAAACSELTRATVQLEIAVQEGSPLLPMLRQAHS